MLRWVALSAAAILMAVALVAFASAENQPALPPPPPNVGFRVTAAAAQTLHPPEAVRPESDREAKRLARYDRDKNGTVDRGEYLRSRERAFAKLDANRDGRLDFEEYAARTIDKFKGADGDRSGELSADEFAITATKRKAKPKLNCPPVREESEA